MPYAHPELKLEVAKFVAPLGLGGTVVEIGPGAGQIGMALREAAPLARLQAVEVYEPYIAQFQLTNIYNQILVRDVRETADWFWTGSHPAVTLTVWIDGPEHLPKKSAVRQVPRLASLSRLGLLFSTPLGDWPQGAWTDADGGVNEAETHLSSWSKEEWEKLGAVCVWESAEPPACAMFHLKGAS